MELSGEPERVEVVLFTEYVLMPGARPERMQHYAARFAEAHIDIADAMGLGTDLLFPASHGTAVAVALGARIDGALNDWRAQRATPVYLDTLQRLRALARACREHPRAQVIARTI